MSPYSIYKGGGLPWAIDEITNIKVECHRNRYLWYGFTLLHILSLFLAVPLPRTLTCTLTRTLRLPLTPTLTLGKEQLSDTRH